MSQPPARGVLRWALLVLAIPVTAQLILVAAGAADLAASLCCIAVEILAGLGLGLFFRRDVERLGRLLGGEALETPRLAALQRGAIAASPRSGGARAGGAASAGAQGGGDPRQPADRRSASGGGPVRPPARGGSRHHRPAA